MPKGPGYKRGKATFINKKGKEKIIKPLKAKKDKRKKNAHFEGPYKNSGADLRKAKNQERRSI